MTRIAPIAGAVLCLCVNGCASAPPPTERGQVDRVLVSGDGGIGTIHSYKDPGVTVATFKSPRTVVVPILKAAYEELAIPVKVADPTTGQVGNNFFIKTFRLGKQPLSHYLICGDNSAGPVADNYKITMSVLSVVSANGSGSSVNTIVQARADSEAGSSGSIQCQTTGYLEDDLHRVLLRRLGDREL